MKLAERRAVRMIALQALYELDCTEHPADHVIPERIRGYEANSTEAEEPISADQRLMIYKLVNGVVSNRPRLDRVIQIYAAERPLDEVAVIDRNILRMAIYEFAIDRETPVNAAINEAVELAKEFGADSASKFVNGVLGTIARHENDVQTTLAEVPGSEESEP